jgi:hypothetical protein
MQFTVVQGDIARQEADVLVNAAGTSLKTGSGVRPAGRGVYNRGGDRGLEPTRLCDVVLSLTPKRSETIRSAAEDAT